MRLAACLAMILVAGTVAHACSCMGPTPVCKAFTNYPVIFRGTVVNQTISGMTVKVDFVVAETFRGEASQIRSISTNQQSSACGFQFEKGLQYVVFASADKDGNLVTGTCSRTHQVNPSAQDADIEWMRQYPTAPPTATIFGGIFLKRRFRAPDVGY